MKNRKLAVGIGGVTAVAAAVALTAGTYAAFSDSEQRGAVATAGTMDLQASSATGDVFSGNGVIDVDPLAPGDSRTAAFTLTNKGDVAGDLSFELVRVENNENSLTEPESAAGDETGGDSVGRGGGELLQNLEFTTATGAGETVIDGNTVAELVGEPHSAGTLDANESRTFEVALELPRNTTNVVQSDSARFVVKAVLNQNTDNR
ncbi:putative ribosomally synthesized peptide with SipW-like signal peptide [Halopolyspora algeriensis]|uniref:Putative ribosomally synthesized peptide with SipW-like signal peptide n=1 Tax=Halopolyspora algeriensis TaxID=1500506 RepID=A0A368VX03_9ACTN|nr:TasA family protein [Halopolyspora algeriensis]RCW45268.1 putative ribosomally synthesized peptide with SipW-like signal peptide [Halopolyspora algeriensis]TQM53013.1 putative ribosomally synthesized peptide with SipW-like signal peptide [Halopolyspora algeriensis]